MRLTRFLPRVLCFPSRARFTDEDTLDPHVQPLARERESLGLYTSGDNINCIIISHIRATDVAIRLRRIPVGFYVVVKNENVTKRTSNQALPVQKNVVEWDDEMVFPADRGSKISFTVVASFEMGVKLGTGEVLCLFEITVGELLGCNGQLDLVQRLKQNNQEVVSSPSAFEIKIDERVCSRNEYGAVSHPPEPESIRQLEEETDDGHRALVRYRELEQKQDLDESIRHFELARDLCPTYHSSRGTVLFNLATAKMIYCRVNDVSPDLDMAIDLYRTVLDLRPHDHPDRPWTLLGLGVALGARFQRQRNEADKKEGRTLLTRVVGITKPDSYAYHIAVIALGSAVEHELVPRTEDPQGAKVDDGGNGEVQRLDGILQRILHPDSPRPALLDHLGILFCVPFERLGDLADRDSAIPMVEVVVQFAPDTHPDKHAWLSNLSSALLTRHMRSGDVADIERSISMFEHAMRFTPHDHPARSTLLNNLAHAFSRRYACLGDLADLEKSTSIRQDLVESTPDDDPDKPLLLYNLGDSVSIRYRCFGDVTDLGKSISLFEEAVRSTPDGHPDKPLRLGNFAYSLSQRYIRFGDIADLERSISIREDVLSLTPDGDPEKPSRLNNLGGSLATRYDHFGDAVDLEKSVSLHEDAVRLTPDGHPDKPLRLNNLGDVLLTHYQRFGDVVYLEKSILMLEDAVKFTPDGHPNKSVWLNNLARSLSERYTHFGDIGDLDRATSMREHLATSTHDDHPDKPLRLNNFGDSLFARYTRFGDIVDLNTSISMFKDAVQLTPDDHPDKSLWLNNLGNVLATRYQRLGEEVDLEESILILEAVVQFTPDDHPEKPLRLHNLGDSLSTRYKRFGNVVDLNKSIAMLEDAVKLTPDGHPNTPLWLDNLARSFLQRYMRFGDLVDLDRVVSMREDLLESTSGDHPDRALHLSRLGESLAARYQRFGDVVDLQKSVSLLEGAAHVTPDGHPDKPLRLNNLGNVLATRYERFGDAADLGRSISLFEDAMQLTPDNHPDKQLQLNNLGDLLLSRYRRFGDVVDLERSMSLLEDAVRFTPDDHPDRLVRLNNFAHSLSECFVRSGDPAVLERAISIKEDVAKSTPDDHPNRPSHLCSLTDALLHRFQRSGDPESPDLGRAVLYSSDAARSHTGPSLDRFRASQLWIQCLRLLRRDSQSLLDAYTVAMELLPQLAWLGLSLHDRYYQLLQAEDEVCDGVATALEACRPELAVEWLEQGRSIVWSQLSQLRTPMDDIRTIYPELAARFERVSRELENASSLDSVWPFHELTNQMDTMTGLLEKQARQHHTLAVSREGLLAEIRALPGFERFLLPKTFKQLSSSAYSGPVVFLNASRLGCDALVVKADSQDVVHVPLSRTNYDEVKGMQLQLNKLLSLHGRVISRDASNRGARLHRMGPDDVFRTILSWLWEKVVSPILDVLAFSSETSGPQLRRIFWCPTGPFTFLPVHAAGIYDETNPGPKLSDFIVSSYIPTMSALELPRHRDASTEAKTRRIRLLAVRQPSTDGQVHLSGVPMEMQIIKELTSSSPFVDLQEADGTVEDVLAKMAQTDWVHFACHGTQDRTTPFDSGLLLADCRRLKLADMAQLSRPNEGLAFLSACHTATGDEQLSEEAIHLAAGMLRAGYKSVIATMWTIMDGDAPKVTEKVYKSLFRDGKVPDGGQAAQALHHAIEQLRDSGASFLSWVPFIHVGL